MVRVEGPFGDWDEQWDAKRPPAGVRFQVLRDTWITEDREVPLRIIQEVALVSVSVR